MVEGPNLMAYENGMDKQEHLALVKGEIGPDDVVLVRVHSECFTGDVLGSMRCDCGEQMHAALKMIEKEGKGVFLYMRQEGRGIGLVNKLKAYCFARPGSRYGGGKHRPWICPGSPRLWRWRPDFERPRGPQDEASDKQSKKDQGNRGYGLTVVEGVALEMLPTKDNIMYLKTKQEKLGHILNNI